jgi:hypothetical protein
MRGFKGLLVLAVALPLGGCFSVTAPKDVPGWAMSPQAVETGEAQRRKVSRRTTARAVAAREEAGADETPAHTGEIQTDNAAMPTGAPRPAVRTIARPAASAGAGPTAFTPEWHARENAADEALRRRMNICTGC